MDSLILKEEVKQKAYNHYLASLFVEDDKRPAVWAFILFYQEVIERVPLLSEPQLGRVRLHWWKEELEKLLRRKKTDLPSYIVENFSPLEISLCLDLIKAAEKYIKDPNLFFIYLEKILKPQGPFSPSVKKLGEVRSSSQKGQGIEIEPDLPKVFRVYFSLAKMYLKEKPSRWKRSLKALVA